MKRWTEIVLVLCAAGVAAAEWLVSLPVQGLLSGLLLGLVILTVFSQRSAMRATVDSLNAAHREQLESERRYRALFDACSDAILVYRLNDDGRPGELVEANEAACLGLGYSRAQLLALPVRALHAPEAQAQVLERTQSLGEDGTLVYETVHLTSDRQRIPVEVSAKVVHLGGRRLCLAVSHSIAERKELEDFLRSLSDIDELTGLLNRRGFFLRAEEVKRLAKRAHAPVLLLFADVDGLKQVNDELGHAEGDKLLVAAADVLREAFRIEDVVARLGGDEFAALAILGDRHDVQLDCRTFEGRLEEAVDAARAALSDAFPFSISFGLTVATAADLNHIDDLLARADQRMYEAKRTRRPRVRA